MHGSISAFNKTFTAIHRHGTASTTATANINRRLPVTDEASKAENESVDDSSWPSLMTPENDYVAPRLFYDPYGRLTQSFTFHQASGDKAETTEPSVQPPTHSGSWQPSSLPPPFPSLAAYGPSLTPQDDWPFQDDTTGGGLGRVREGWAVDLAHLSSSTSGGHQDENVFDIE